MKLKVLILAVLISVFAFQAKSQKIYEAESPIEANVKYCIVSSPIRADVVVYRANSPVYSGVDKNEGVWYFCQSPIQAQVKICKVPEVQSQLKVCFTDSPIMAGWKNTEKKSLMNPQRYQN